MELIVKSKYIITDPTLGENGIKEDMSVYVLDDTIVEIGKSKDLMNRYPNATVVGNGKQLVMPGLIDAHSHGCGLSFIQRGIHYDYLENSLIDWAHAIDIDPELNSMLSAIRHIRNGCTTMHHNNWGSAFDETAFEKANKRIKGYKRAGIRLAYSPGIRNKNVLAYDDEKFYDTLPGELKEFANSLLFDKKQKKMAINYYLELFENLYKNYNKDNCKILLGPSWVQGSTDEFLINIKEKSNEKGGIPIHIHILQTPVQKAYGLRKYGKSLLAHLNELGLVDDKLVCGHAVYFNQGDIEIMANYNSSVTNHVSCNLAVRNGIAPIYEYLRAGINVALGIDDKGINDDEDAIMELRMINYLNRIPGYHLTKNPPLDAFEIIKIGTVNAAKVCGYKGEIGKLAPDMRADIIMLDLEDILGSPWSSPNLNIAEMFLYRAKGQHVNTVIIDGKIIMENYKFLYIDIDSLYKEIKIEAQKGLSDEAQKYARNLQKIKPYYQNWYNKMIKELSIEPYYNMNSKV